MAGENGVVGRFARCCCLGFLKAGRKRRGLVGADFLRVGEEGAVLWPGRGVLCEDFRFSWKKLLSCELGRPERRPTCCEAKTVRARSFWIVSSSASSMATWFCILESLGQVARCPVSMQPSIYSGVGLLRTRGKSA